MNACVKKVAICALEEVSRQQVGQPPEMDKDDSSVRRATFVVTDGETVFARAICEDIDDDMYTVDIVLRPCPGGPSYTEVQIFARNAEVEMMTQGRKPRIFTRLRLDPALV